MFKYFVALIIIICLSCSTSNEKGNFLSDFPISYINVFFSYNGQIRYNMDFNLIDSNDILNNKKFDCFNRRCVTINHEKYLEFFNEIKRINFQNKDDNKTKTYIEIAKVENNILVDSLLLNSYSQINEYIVISEKILGKKNYMPLNEFPLPYK